MNEQPKYMRLSSERRKWILKEPFGDESKKSTNRLVLFIALILLDTIHPIDIGGSSFFGISFVDSNSPPALREIFFYPTFFYTIQLLIHAVPELIQWNNELRVLARNEVNDSLENVHETINKVEDKYQRMFKARHNLSVQYEKFKREYKRARKVDIETTVLTPPSKLTLIEMEKELLRLMEAMTYTEEILPECVGAVTAFHKRVKDIDRAMRITEAWKIIVFLSWQFCLPLAASCWCLYVSYPF